MPKIPTEKQLVARKKGRGRTKIVHTDEGNKWAKLIVKHTYAHFDACSLSQFHLVGLVILPCPSPSNKILKMLSGTTRMFYALIIFVFFTF